MANSRMTKKKKRPRHARRSVKCRDDVELYEEKVTEDASTVTLEGLFAEERREISEWRRQLKAKAKVKKDYWEKDHVSLAAFHMVNIAKDFFDSFTRYKSPYHMVRNLAQPVHGIRNILMAVGHFVKAIILFLGLTYGVLFKDEKYLDARKNKSSLKILLNSASLFIRGVTQVAIIIFTWPLMVPRAVFTWKFGFRSAEEVASEKCSGDQWSTIARVLAKNSKHRANHQPSKPENENETEARTERYLLSRNTFLRGFIRGTDFGDDKLPALTSFLKP